MHDDYYGALVAECDGVSAEDVRLLVARLREWGSKPEERASGLPGYMQLNGIRWGRRTMECCGVSTYWAAMHNTLPNAYVGHAQPTCPVCDPVGARQHDARSIDKLARALWKAHPDVVLAEMDRKLEAAEFGGDALEALAGLKDYVRRCEAEISRLRRCEDQVSRLRAELEHEREHLAWLLEHRGASTP